MENLHMYVQMGHFMFVEMTTRHGLGQHKYFDFDF